MNGKTLSGENYTSFCQAAISFANDYGPLPSANRGDEWSMDMVARRLAEALKSRGISIVFDETCDRNMTHEWQEDGYVIKCSVCHIAKSLESAKTPCVSVDKKAETLGKTAV